MPTLHRYNGSAWVQVPNGTAFKHYNGSAWVNPTNVKYWDGDSWETVWTKSDPKTVSFRATATNSWRSTGWRGANDLRAGNFMGFGTHIGLMNFTDATSTGDISGQTIATIIGTRPNLTNVKLTLERNTAVGTNPFGAGSGTQNSYYVGYYSSAGGSFASGNASSLLTTTNMATISYATLAALGWNYSESKDLTLNANVGTQAATRYIWISDMSTGWLPNTGSDSTPIYSEVYASFEGDPSDSNCATLTFTADF